LLLLKNANDTPPEVQPLEAYAAKLDDGSHVAIHADEFGAVSSARDATESFSPLAPAAPSKSFST